MGAGCEMGLIRALLFLIWGDGAALMRLRCALCEGGLENGDAWGCRTVKRRERRGPGVGAG